MLALFPTAVRFARDSIGRTPEARHALLASAALLLTTSLVRAAVPSIVPGVIEPALAGYSIVTRDTTPPPCRTPECVRRHANAASIVRLAGEFGSFTGRVARWDGDSLAGFSADPDWGGTSPAAAVGWSQVERLDKRVSNARRGAVVGALGLGSLTALFAAVVSSLALIELAPFDAHDRRVGGAALVGAAIGGTVGAGLGAAIGSTSNRWEAVYRRPVGP